MEVAVAHHLGFAGGCVLSQPGAGSLQISPAGKGSCCREALEEAAGTWLAEHAPAGAPGVVCHGDLHPFNLLIDTDGDVTVLDWSGGLLAPPAYDLAFTGLVLSEPPVGVPRMLRPLVRAGGRALARRFRRTYVRETRAPIDSLSLAWHEGLICLRVLAEVAGWVAAGQVEERHGHPWIVAGPAFAARLSRLTGVSVTAR